MAKKATVKQGPKTSYTMKFTDTTIKRVEYLAHKIDRKEGEHWNRTVKFEKIIDHLYKCYKEGIQMGL